MKSHLARLLKVESNEVPWLHMGLCAWATALPLLVGITQAQPGLAIVGALCGYLLALNDHSGKVVHRLLVVTLTFCLLVAGFVAGGVWSLSETAFQLFLAGFVYWLGLLSGEGGELERGALFATLGLLIARSTPRLPPQTLQALLLFSASGYAALMVGIPLTQLWWKQRPLAHATLTESLRKSLTRRLGKHIHAASYTLMTLIALWLYHHFGWDRGYWIPITLLLIMKPDRSQSVFMTLQRLTGTLAAVLLASLTVNSVHEVLIYAALCIGCAFAVPWARHRNYGLMTFFVTLMVIGFLEIAVPSHSDARVPLLRLQATLIGCGLSLAGSGLSTLLHLLFDRPSVGG